MLAHSLYISAAAPDEERARPLATAAAMLLAVWLADCPAAISALLTLPGVVDTFVGVIADRCG
jgi:endonuclease III